MRRSIKRWQRREHVVLFAIGIAIAAMIVLFVARSAGAADAAAAATTAPTDKPAASENIPPDAIVMVVMDPLALPLSCPCVKGYAQRDYDKLGAKLQQELGHPVRVIYNESLTTALKGDAHGRADVVIGKHSVVLFDAKRSGIKMLPVASLTGKDGATTQTGLVVVPTDDPAKKVSDLAGYHLVFGPPECDEKYAAAMSLLSENGVAVPDKVETSPACSDGACLVLDDFKKDQAKHGAAVISSYAKPLLEGCGTVEKGALRVVGETAAVPFVEAFVNSQVPADQRERLAKAVLKSTEDPLLRIALETRSGFIALKDDGSPVADAKKK
jgi:ABC-type phosphate/phosphonate transport system substrate-binding protein